MSVVQRVFDHVTHHRRFYAAAAFGVVVWLGQFGREMSLRTVVAGDAFFIAYLALVAVLLRRRGGVDFRRQAGQGDEGLFLVSALAMAAVGLSVGAMFFLLNARGHDTAFQVLFATLSVPLAWLTLHTVYAFHYARLYFLDHEEVSRGLNFPGHAEPGYWEFLYFSFVIGMTAQVSDVSVTSSRLRRLVLMHGIVSFFFNTVILALAVNVVVTMNT